MGAATIAIALALTALPAETPADAVILAAQDLGRLPEKDRYLYRYFWAGHLPLGERRNLWRVLGGHCNQLSTSPDITPMQVLPGETLARINLVDWAWGSDTWEKLLLVEPYFHIHLTGSDGQKVVKDGPWLIYHPGVMPADNVGPARRQVNLKSLEALKYLYEGTTSQVPIVLADFFHWQTAQQAEREPGPGYYDFLGIKDEATYDRIVGFDEEILKRFPIEVREVAAKRKVTLQPRRLERKGKIGGSKWKSKDVILAEGKSNPLQVLDRSYEFDASETIAHLANGFQAYGAFNKNGKRADVAPSEIASDGVSPSTDKRVHVGISCIRCHGPHVGYHPIEGWVRKLKPQKDGSIPGLKSFDYATIKALNRLYFQDLDPLLDQDRLIYQTAVQKATGGMGVKDWSKAYGEQFADYDSGVTVKQAASFLGMTPESFRKAIKDRSEKTNDVDPAMILWLEADSEENREEKLPIRVWHQQHGALQLLLRGGRDQ